MTFSDISRKMLLYHFFRYCLYFFCNFLAAVIFFCFASLFTNPEFMDGDLVDSMISSNIIFPSVVAAVFLVLYLPFSYAAFLNARKQEYGILLSLGMSRREVVRNILIEGVVISAAALFAALLIGTVLASGFYGITAKIIGIHRLKWRFRAEPYMVTAVLYGAVSMGTLALQACRMYTGKIVRLLKAPYETGTKRSCPRILGLPDRGVFSHGNHVIEKAALSRHKTDWTVRYVTASFILAAMIFFGGLCVCIRQSFYYDVEVYAPFDALYVEIHGMNQAEKEEVREIAEETGNAVTGYKEMVFARDAAFNYLPVSEINKKFGCDYRIEPGEFLNLFPYDMGDGYKHELIPVDSCIMSSGNRLRSAGYDVRILWNQNPAFADRTLIVGDEDFAYAVQSSDYWSGTIHMFSLEDWRASAGFMNGLQRLLQERSNVSEKEHERYYKASSKLDDFQRGKLSGDFLLFVMSFVILLLYLAQWILIHFRILAEREEMRRMVRSLRLVGTAKEEILQILRFKNRVRFLPQILTGWIGAGVLIYFSVRCMYGMGMLGECVSGGMALVLFLGTMIFIPGYSRREYLFYL